MDIFGRNIGALTKAEQEAIASKKVFIAGAGGLGGYAAEFCVRIGIGNLVICDRDVFEESNLNRQRFSDIYRLGQSKAQTAREKLLDINPTVSVKAYDCVIDRGNLVSMAADCDIIIDALDNVEGRFVLEEVAEKLNIPLILGAVDGWCGQISAIMPGDKTVTKLYADAQTRSTPPVTVMTAAVTAGLQVAEAVKTLLGRPSLKNKLLVIDLEDYTLEILNF